MKKRQKADMKG